MKDKISFIACLSHCAQYENFITELCNHQDCIMYQIVADHINHTIYTCCIVRPSYIGLRMQNTAPNDLYPNSSRLNSHRVRL